MEETTLMLDSTAIKVHNTLVGLKRGYHEETGRSKRRLDHEGPCGNGWTWESIALFALQWEL